MYFKKGKLKLKLLLPGKSNMIKGNQKTKDWNRDKARYFRKSSNICFLAIGSNLGNKINNINNAKKLLKNFRRF